MLAKYLATQTGLVSGRTVLDFGCGGGLAGIAALKAGARKLIANDTDPVAVWMAGRNAARNGFGTQSDLALDLETKNLLQLPPPPEVDIILVGDMFYDRTVSLALVEWLGKARKQGAAILIADGSRPFAPKSGVSTLLEETYATDADLEGRSERVVRLLSFQP